MTALALAAEPATIGHNGAPEADPWEGLKVHLDDLLSEAHNWADGTNVENQAQADEASRLIDDLNKAAKLAEAQRVAEKEPHDKAISEIQGRYNPYIADPKTKNPGKVWKAIDALKAAVKPYLERLKAEQEAEAKRRREEAEKAAAEAAAAVKAAAANDLAAQEEAEAKIKAAEHAQADAKRAENAKAQARGGSRAMGLRTVSVAHLTDRKAALLHYVATRPDEIVSTLQRLADQDVREGKRSIPGFDVREETRL